MSEAHEKDLFEQMVDKVLAYRPKKKRKKQKRKAKKARKSARNSLE